MFNVFNQHRMDVLPMDENFSFEQMKEIRTSTVEDSFYQQVLIYSFSF